MNILFRRKESEQKNENTYIMKLLTADFVESLDCGV